jgi:hypothetical protein
MEHADRRRLTLPRRQRRAADGRPAALELQFRHNERQEQHVDRDSSN